MSISISGSAITYSMILSLLDHLLHDLIIYSMIFSPTPWFYHYLITYSMILSSTPWSYHLLHDFIITWSLTPWFYHLLHFITYSHSKFKCRRKGVLAVRLSNLHSHTGRKWWGRGVWKGEACSFFLLLHFNSMPTQVHNRVGKVWVVNKTSDSDMTSKYHNAQTLACFKASKEQEVGTGANTVTWPSLLALYSPSARQQ